MTTKNNTLFSVLALGVITIAGQASADRFWDGVDTTANADGGSGTWNNVATNWDTLATSGSNATWDNTTAFFGGTAGTVTLGSNITANALSFTTSGYTIAGAGNTITLGAGGDTDNGTIIGSSTINANIDNAGFQLSAYGGTKTINGIISGSGGLITSNGGSTLLTGANTYTGATTVSSRTTSGSSLSISSFNSVNGGTPLMASSSLGAPTSVANGTITIGRGSRRSSNTLIYEGAAAMGETTDRVINFQFNGGATQTITASGSGLLRFTSAFTPYSGTQDGTVRFNGTGEGEIVQDLAYSSTRTGLNKSGSGTWTLNGGTFNNTVVAGGALVVNGTLNNTTTVTVSSGATLGGVGTIGGDATVSGTLTPGNSPGTMTFLDDLTMNVNSTYAFEAGDLVAVTGALALVDNWTLDLGEGLQDGGSITIFTFGSLAGGADLVPTFDVADLGFSPTGPLSLSNTGSSIVLNGVSAIPEPGSLTLLGLGVMLLARRRRRGNA